MHEHEAVVIDGAGVVAVGDTYVVGHVLGDHRPLLALRMSEDVRV